MGYESDSISTQTRGFSDEPQVAPPKKPFYRRGGFLALVVFLCVCAAVIPPLVVFRDRLSTSPKSPFADPPFWNGTGPNNNPFGTCFTMEATAFQPYWKEQQTTTWCGAQFNRSSPIFSLPLLNMSAAVGSDQRVTHDVDRQLWNNMTRNWCGAEAKITGPAGEFTAFFGDANVWRSVDLDMALYETIKGVPNGTYSDPDQARWMDGVRVCFTGGRIDVSQGYPFSYPL
ncbi:Myosin class II heavy chain [Pseudozyma hubeiensis]|nr:Myosin class II heavy chain [Pseudozyma hubeiensis]